MCVIKKKKICYMSYMFITKNMLYVIYYMFINVYYCTVCLFPQKSEMIPRSRSVQVLAQLYRTEQDGKAVSKRKELKISYVFIPVYTQ